MDSISNMRAFLAVVEARSFSEAARRMNVPASVISKRVKGLESELGADVLHRTTRRVALTPYGEQSLPSIRTIVGQYDELAQARPTRQGQLVGSLKIKAPAPLAAHLVQPVAFKFMESHPDVSLTLDVISGVINPIEAGYDICFGLLPSSFPRVTEEPMFPFPRFVFASPEYLRKRGVPNHPSDLAMHDCLVFSPLGRTWSFHTSKGPLNVHVRSRLSSADTRVLETAALAGMGIVTMSDFTSSDHVANGKLVKILDNSPLTELWVKAQIPDDKLRDVRVRQFLSAIRAEAKVALA